MHDRRSLLAAAAASLILPRIALAQDKYPSKLIILYLFRDKKRSYSLWQDINTSYTVILT